MSADDISPGSQWPLPPAWMFTCTDCVRLYKTMKEIRAVTDELWLTGERGVDWDPFDSAVGAQIRLARHLASAHQDLLPDWDPACPRCTEHRNSLVERGQSDLLRGRAEAAREHRAYHVFAPPHGVGLM
ncbi:hypothetical protein ACFYWY_13275 [Streptomyces sp. NPDC002870]|uniref:hypothetical protein n=1 Tax=Streptomyces sp. NPDC002870 TaxID=3364666 RepID=UPI0036B63F03